MSKYILVYGCSDCKWCKYVSDRLTPEDSFEIKCIHPDQESEESYQRQLGRVHGPLPICPLPDLPEQEAGNK